MNYRSIFFIFIAFILISFGGFGNGNINRDKAVELYYKAVDFYGVNPDSMIYYANLLQDVAIKINYKRGEVNAAYLKGDAYFDKKIYDQAAAELYRGLNIIHNESVPDVESKELKILHLLGLTYDETYNYSLSTDFYSRAIDLAYQMNDSLSLGQLYLCAGLSQYNLDKHDKALNALERSLDFLIPLNKKILLSRAYNGFGLVYKKKNEYDKAIHYYKLAIEASNIDSNISEETTWYVNNIGNCYLIQNKLDSATLYFNTAFTMSEKRGDTAMLKLLLNNMGNTQLKRQNFNDAIAFFQRSIELAKADTYDYEYTRAAKGISEAYMEIGDFKNASFFKDQIISQTELLSKTNKELLEKIDQYKMRAFEWELEKQQKEAQLTYMRKANFWFKTSMILLVFILSFASYKAVRYYSGIRAVKRWLATDEI